MKALTNLSRRRRRARGFTLIELLVVIAIIGILAAMLLPALARVKTHAKIKKAQLQANQIKNAIIAYESANSRFPAPTDVADEAAKESQDFTFGNAIDGKQLPRLVLGAVTASHYENAEVIAILMDIEKYPGSGNPTVDANHVKNPHKVHYLNAKMVSDPALPDVGPDLVYRDPWGHPYVITMDLNYDGKARDVLYSIPEVSRDPNSPNNRGLNGLIKTVLPSGAIFYELNGTVMVWSAGPDGKFDGQTPADQGVNKDNILTW